MNEQQDDILKIEVTGNRGDAIPFDSFLELARNTLSILQDLDASISQSDNASLEWEIIGASLSSPLVLTIEGRSDIGIDIGGDVIRAYLTGVEEIEKGTQEVPQYFTEVALRRTRDLVNVLNDGIKKIAFYTPSRSEPVVPSKKALDNVAVILEAQDLEEESNNVVELHAHQRATKEEQATITGTLETVTVHGKKPKFVIYDPLTGNRIDCFFQEERLDEIKALLPSRVSVTGTAKHNKQGYPTSIVVEAFRRLRGKGELPSFRDLEGINFSGDLDPTEYVRRLRNS